MNIIQIENLTFKYPPDSQGREKTVLDGVNLAIEEGSFVCVLGQNGSGKSTLARHMNGLLIPTEGEVLVSGMDTKDPEFEWDIRETVGMVFQNPDNQIVSSIVEDDVAFGPENIGIDPETIRQRVDSALESVRMGGYQKKGPHMLSGGQKQRIAIAGAIAMKPKCIVFDEPTAMLDPAGRRELIEIIKRLNEEGITIVLITHFMEEAAEADKVVILSKGQVALEGSPEEVFAEKETLAELGLEVPPAAKLAEELRSRGMEISKSAITKGKLLKEIVDISAK